MIRIKEEWVASYKDEEIFDEVTFDIFKNPGSKDWKDIHWQSRFYKIPVRFVFMDSMNLYVGAVVFHADLADKARELEGSHVRGRIDGVVNTAEKVYSIKIFPNATEDIIEEFYDTLFYRKILKQYTESKSVPEMANEVH